MAEPSHNTTKKKGKKSLRAAAANKSHVPPGQQLTTFTTPSLDAKGRMQIALRLSLTGGTFLDTKFYAFSRRRSTGVVGEPLPVYANSDILRASSKYFDGFFEGGFSEAKVAPLQEGFPADKPTFADEYGYESDSDLEDELESVVDTELQNTNHEAEIGSSSSDNPKKDADQLDTVEPRTDIQLMDRMQDPSFPGTNTEHYGHTILMPDIAYATWKALIFWIYTGEIVFAPLKSQNTATDASKPPVLISALPCSPKSMYRLADKVIVSLLSSPLNSHMEHISVRLRRS
ncbi:hypothetical protein BDW22DRAFT_1358995 [Trametopsis cervina]|nr:hypothetical protein BDW22DRAFT_1358995 [Trametopsis cervina]